ncbi:MAG: DNRLRE domain-containing protein, partial [Chitinophagaceae bacterium]|nr:DNRLRE domain-containing protein [Chitinophagaceae bacterium]
MKKLFLLLITTLFFTDIYSQCSTTVLPVLGGTSANGRAPNGRFRTIRTAYLITPLEMNLAGYANGTALSGIGWNYSTAPGVSVTGSLKVYLANTVDATYNLGTDYTTVSTSVGMTLVHNATTTLPATIGTFDIPFVGGSPFLYTGNGIYVVFEWVDCTSTLSTTAALQCNTTLVNGLVGFQTTAAAPCPAALPTAMAVSSFRPETRFSTNILNDVKVDYVYTQGELSLGNSVAIPTAARITNLSANTYLNFPVTLDVTGANTFSATTTIASLPGCSTQYVQLSNITPTANGINTVTVSVPNDNNNFNNAFAVQQTVSYDKFGMRYLGQVAYPTGVGFTGASGVFCAKFSTANPIMISKVDVDFTVIGQPYRIAIYPDNSGTPGTVPLYVDAVDRITIANPIEEVLSSMVSVPAGNFYVTIHQTTTTNIGVAYAQEQPVRTNTFFYSTLPPATWTDFSVGGAQFKVLLGARICYPFPPTNLVGNAIVCTGTSQTYTVDPVAGASSYVWTLPGGWTGTSTTTSITTIPSGTSGNVQCAAVFPCGTSTVTSMAVTVNPLPTVTATPSSITVCQGDNVTLTGGISSSPVTIILTPSKDNSIYQENTGNSNGAGPNLLAGRINFGNFSNRALLAFDLSTIPAGAIITGASLQLNCSQVPNLTPQVINLHKLNENWGEGTSVATSPGAGIAATANDATWSNAFHPGTAWTTSGGVFNPTVSASTSVTGTGFYTWTNANMVNDIQSWLTTPASNFGWMIKGIETAIGQARRFDSRENTTPANRPQLTITYTIPVTYTWTGGITDNTPFAVTSSNVYQVTGTDANGCSNTATSSVTMNAAPNISTTPSASTTKCDGAGVML